MLMLNNLGDYILNKNYIEESLFFLLIILFFAFVGILLLRESIIFLLLCFEMCFLGIIFLFLILSLIFNDSVAQVIVLILFSVAAVESSITLAAVVIFYRITSHTSLLISNDFIKA